MPATNPPGSALSTYLLLACITLAAIAAGVLATRRSRGNDPDPPPPATGH